MEDSQENPVRTICVTAVLAALIFVLTYVPKIPIPLGYAHLGDAAIIKWIMVEIVFRVIRPESGIWHVRSGRTLLAFSLSSAWMAAAYTVAGGLLYGSMGAALASTPGLIMEGVINTIVAIAAGTLLEKAGIQK